MISTSYNVILATVEVETACIAQLSLEESQAVELNIEL